MLSACGQSQLHGASNCMTLIHNSQFSGENEFHKCTAEENRYTARGIERDRDSVRETGDQAQVNNQTYVNNLRECRKQTAGEFRIAA